ncbi:MAG: hypothetical protein ACLU9S_11440 [Oscillospiraceae bacterium]
MYTVGNSRKPLWRGEKHSGGGVWYELPGMWPLPPPPRITVKKDEPVISGLTPAASEQTGENRRPSDLAAVANAGEAPTVEMTVANAPVDAVYAGGTVTYTPAEDLAEGRTSVTVTVTRADGKVATKTWSFTVGVSTAAVAPSASSTPTTYSDGSGSLDTALDYIAGLPDSANIDFVAFTDHSNYFDKSGEANPEGALYDMSLATAYSQERWAEFQGKVDSFNAAHSDLIALGGFGNDLGSGGPGHINTQEHPGHCLPGSMPL